MTVDIDDAGTILVNRLIVSHVPSGTMMDQAHLKNERLTLSSLRQAKYKVHRRTLQHRKTSRKHHDTIHAHTSTLTNDDDDDR